MPAARGTIPEPAKGAPVDLVRRRMRRLCVRMPSMLGLIATLLVVALITGVLSLGGLAGAAVEVTKVIFAIVIVLFLISAIVSLARGRTRVRRKHPVN
jgi:uncharacterized membrane protein YtjA (UPF0391 family)